MDLVAWDTKIIFYKQASDRPHVSKPSQLQHQGRHPPNTLSPFKQAALILSIQEPDLLSLHNHVDSGALVRVHVREAVRPVRARVHAAVPPVHMRVRAAVCPVRVRATLPFMFPVRVWVAWVSLVWGALRNEHMRASLQK
eukprot:1157368-Pelagomonas_calceolata.AAC.6